MAENENHQKASKKKSLFNSLKPESYQRQNHFIDEVNNNMNNRYYVDSNNINNANHNLTLASNLNQIRQEGYTMNNNANINTNSQTERFRCSVCNIL